jgi:hypothetical protein
VRHWLPVGSETSTVVLLVGMKVGVGYSLFFLRRRREERRAVRIRARRSPPPAPPAGRSSYRD